MKGIFIYYKKIDKKNLTGIDKKVLWQVEQLNQDGIECKLIEHYYDGHSFIMKCFNILMARIPFGNANPEWRWHDYYEDIDFIYFRRPDAITLPLLKLLKIIKLNNPNIKIIMEIPNYPYDEELGLKWINKPLLLKDKYNRRKLEKYIDRIAVQNDIDIIWGIKTLRFLNGIKLEDIEKRVPVQVTYNNSINICAVASLEPWQGYERIFKGLRSYYNSGACREIIIRIAGIGSEFEKYKQIVKEYGLEQRVMFLGKLSKLELEKLYNCSDLAIDTFGRYKTGNNLSTSLKSREYLAKGLPIVTGCKTDILNESFHYYLEFSNDESSISFDKIVDFYDKVYKESDKQDVINIIRNYAKKVCDISTMIEPVKKYLLEN